MTNPSLIAAARKQFHASLIEAGVLCVAVRTKSKNPLPVPSNADSSNKASVAIAQAIFNRIGSETAGIADSALAAQRSGRTFEHLVREFVQQTFEKLSALRPGKWIFAAKNHQIWTFQQYEHLSKLAKLANENPELDVLLGTDYLIAPDVVVGRFPVPDSEINANAELVDESNAQRTCLRIGSGSLPILHASISCKWTLRSDRAQNARSEALNLLRNRKGRAPHIALVTAEPTPSRLASLALGTGDLDCIYHFALPELIESVEALENEKLQRLIRIMVNGNRLKDISDLPFDLAV